jgi:hypothetical protein
MHAVSRGILVVMGYLLPAVACAQTAERPEWKAGDSWTIRVSRVGAAGSGASETTRTVKEVHEDAYIVANNEAGTDSGERTVHVSRDLNGFVRGQGGELEELRWLQWPLEPGRSYSFEQKSGANVFTWSGTVDGWEQVTTPAGTFKAIKVSFTRSGPTRGSATETIWFAPEAKAIVKRVATRPGTGRGQDVTTTEVIAYKGH